MTRSRTNAPVLELAHVAVIVALGLAACGGDSTGTSTAIVFSAVSAGGSDTCGITTEGAVYCWGYDLNGQLGHGTASGSSQASPSEVLGGFKFAKVSAGYGNNCGVTTASAAYCWGTNSRGELGDGTTDSRAIPTAVLGGLNFAIVSTGVGQTCGVTPDHAAYCWGWLQRVARRWGLRVRASNQSHCGCRGAQFRYGERRCGPLVRRHDDGRGLLLGQRHLRHAG